MTALQAIENCRSAGEDAEANGGRYNEGFRAGLPMLTDMAQIRAYIACVAIGEIENVWAPKEAQILLNAATLAIQSRNKTRSDKGQKRKKA